MPAIKLIAFLFFLALCSGCKKDDDNCCSISCEEFKADLLSRNKDKLKAYINEYIIDAFALKHTSEDLEKLSKYISEHCDVKASVACYACIDTYPAMSEIVIRFRDGFDEVVRVLDFWNEHNHDELLFVAIHTD